jgi:hypothetical protein
VDHPAGTLFVEFHSGFFTLGSIASCFHGPLLPLVILGLLAVRMYAIPLKLIETIALHLVAFFWATMVCHGELARSRPRTAHLTEYYLWMALGGVLGGLLNALVAPVVFDRIIEYPLMIALACLLRPQWDVRSVLRGGRQKITTTTGASKADTTMKRRTALRPGGRTKATQPRNSGRNRRLNFPEVGPTGQRLVTAIWIILGIGVGVQFILTSYGSDPNLEKLSKRNFFGLVQVRQPGEGAFNEFYHGTTLHGLQSRIPSERGVALSYFHREGPIGQVFEAFNGPNRKKKIGVVGLGVGSLAAYVERGQEITFYEIDPNVQRVAEDTRYFTFLSDCEKRTEQTGLRIVLGDGRLQLARNTDRYDLLVLDAFSSDSVPVHLLTREALRLYLDHLSDAGILAFNISSKYLRLAPVLAELAADANLLSYVQYDPAAKYERLAAEAALQDLRKGREISPATQNLINEAGQKDIRTGRLPSRWIIMARRPEHFGKLKDDARWQSLTGETGSTVWTDDYSNLVSSFVWSEREEKQTLESIMRENLGDQTRIIPQSGLK